MECLGFERALLVHPAAEVVGLLLLQFPSDVLETLAQTKLISLFKRDTSKGIARSDFRGTQFHETRGAQCLKRISQVYPWILIGPLGGSARQLFNSFIAAFLQSSTAGSGGYDAERRVHLLDVIASILSVREIPEQIRQIQRFSDENGEMWFTEQHQEILQVSFSLIFFISLSVRLFFLYYSTILVCSSPYFSLLAILNLLGFITVVGVVISLFGPRSLPTSSQRSIQRPAIGWS